MSTPEENQLIAVGNDELSLVHGKPPTNIDTSCIRRIRVWAYTTMETWDSGVVDMFVLLNH
jgi:hypothetical protein